MGIPSRGLIKGKNDLATLFPGVAKEWDLQKNQGYSPDMVTAGSSETVCQYVSRAEGELFQ